MQSKNLRNAYIVISVLINKKIESNLPSDVIYNQGSLKQLVSMLMNTNFGLGPLTHCLDQLM